MKNSKPFMKSVVTIARTGSRDPKERLSALKRLLARTDPFSAYREGSFVPIKLTVGDAPCVTHADPALAGLIVSEMKKRGAKPFLFDTSVIYQGARQNAVDHLNLAQAKGFGHAAVGAPFIIADGVFGQDGKEHLIGAKDIRAIKIPSFVGMVDDLFVLSHVTGHIVSRYAGAVKNVAMGMSCRPTKQVQHSSLKPGVIETKCTACGLCVAVCPVRAIAFAGPGKRPRIDQTVCVGCGECICACKFDAVSINWEEDPHTFCRRMVEVARFVLSRFKNVFFVNAAWDMTKECDCISTKDDSIVADDVGILASRDIVSLEKATTDLIRKGGRSDFFARKSDIYGRMLEHAASQGLGSLEYDLVEA